MLLACLDPEFVYSGKAEVDSLAAELKGLMSGLPQHMGSRVCWVNGKEKLNRRKISIEKEKPTLRSAHNPRGSTEAVHKPRLPCCAPLTSSE